MNKITNVHLLIGIGIFCIFFGLFSDIVRARTFLLGPQQIVLIVAGVLLSASGYVLSCKQKGARVNRNLVYLLVYSLIAILISVVIGYVKVDANNSWRYTSDLFSYNTVIHENARGNWGLEFTYGNAFGDHAYFFLILLTPFKYLLQDKIIGLLVLSGPITLALSSVFFFLSCRQLTDARKAFLLSVVFLLGFGLTYGGLFDDRYGMHPDTYSGYLIAAMTGLLLWRQSKRTQNEDSTFQTAAAVSFLILYIIQKEEMALLAVLFFGVTWLLDRKPIHRNLLIFSVLYFFAALLIMKSSQTPFNRTNTSIIEDLLLTLREDRLSFLLFDLEGGWTQPAIYWSVILLGCVIFFITLWKTGVFHPYTISLFLIGVIKMLFSLSIYDFSLNTWHNFPGIVMLTGAVLLQLAISVKDLRFTSRFTVVLVILSVLCFFVFDISFVREQLKTNSNRKPLVNELSIELIQVQKRVDSSRVIALPKYFEKPWAGFRYSLHPRGVYWSPVGIADYILIPHNEARQLTVDYTNAPAPESFKEIFITKNFVLYERFVISEEEALNREYFRKYGIE